MSCNLNKTDDSSGILNFINNYSCWLKKIIYQGLDKERLGTGLIKFK